jgi:RimJ/RimL family protein N-acetyltransferase
MLTVPDLTDGEIRLRIPARRDADPIHRACQDPAIVRFTRVPFPYSLLHAQAFVRNAAHELRAGTGIHLVSADADTDELRGVVGLVRDRTRRSGEVGYWVTPEARGRHVARRSVRLMIEWAIPTLHLLRVQLMADVRNEASQRVAETSGFTREGVLRSYEDRLRDRIDYVVYSMVPGDPAWPIALDTSDTAP